MSIHTTAPEEAAGRLAICELIDAYAYCADFRQQEAQAGLFAAAARNLLHMGEPSEPVQVLTTR